MTTRRQFLKLSALGFGGLSLGAGATKYITDFSGLRDSAGDISLNLIRTPTYCEVCFWKCAGWVYKTRDGEIWKLIGNDEDQHSNGRFCPRGTGGLGMYYDTDRLKTPLIRTGERGKFEFKEASWDEALGVVAEKMKKMAAEHGPESMALLAHGSGGAYFTNLLKAFGSSNIAHPSYAQCRGPREAAFVATFGEPVLSPERTDIRDTKCLVLIGSHIGENAHNGQVQEMSQAIDKGATIITVDPRFSIAAGKSKYWLPIKPATDIALLLSWMNVIITEGLYDREYVEKNTYGFDALKAHVARYTPEWAYGKTTIKPHIIRETAREMAKAAPSVIIHPGRHVAWYGDDTQRARSVAILNALLGSWGRRGGLYNPATKSVPKFPLPEYPKPGTSWREAFPDEYKFAEENVSNALIDATIPDPGRKLNIRGWIVDGTNLINTIPDPDRTLEAIKNLDLLVVVDTMPMEIVSWADVVLPECTYLERYDMIRVAPHRKPAIAVRVPAVEPKYDTKPAWWIAKQIGHRLGLQDYFPYDDFSEVIDWQLKQLGTSLDEMKKVGVKTWDREWDDLYFTEGTEHTFYTDTGKIELYSTSFAAEGFDPLPVYTAHPEPPEGYYRLNYGRAPMHTFSRTINNPNLSDLMAENVVWVNPKVAKAWGLTAGQAVWLMNSAGKTTSFPVKVRVTERIRWDSVYMVHGFGHTQRQLSRAYGKGASDSEMMSIVMKDPIIGATGMRGNFVTFLTEKPEEVTS